MSKEIATVRRSLAPTTFAEAMEFSQYLAKSDMVPAGFRNKPENILLAVQWGQEVGLGPMQALQSVAVINGKPSVFGDALLGMVKGSPACEDVIERFEGSGDDLAAVCEARRAGKAPVIARFSVADAKKAGLWGKAGPWQSYPRRMLQMRARGFALRDAFPDVLRGVITREEAEDYPGEVGARRELIDVTPREDRDTVAAAADQDDGLRLAAEEAAGAGVEGFRDFWRKASAEHRAALKPDIAEYQRVAMDADARRAIASDEDPFEEDKFGLKPLPTGHSPPAQQQERSATDGSGGPAPAGEPEHPQEGAARPFATADTAPSGGDGGSGGSSRKDGGGPTATTDASRSDHVGPVDMFQRDENLTVPLPARPTVGQLDHFARQMLHMIGEGPKTAQRMALIKRANERGIELLKTDAVAHYDELMAALAWRAA